MISIKSDKEITLIAEASAIVAEILAGLKKFIKPGVTTKQIEQRAIKIAARHKGAELAFRGYKGYPGCICTSVNQEVVHGIPGDRKLKSGDIISIDAGIGIGGYYGDAAITVPVGKISKQLKKLIDTTEDALDAGIEMMRPGMRLYDISHAIQACAETAGYSVVREFVGHGIGSKLHEEPAIPNYGKPNTGSLLKPNMVFAIEPMVNIGGYRVKVLKDGWTAVTTDGKPSAHFEHTVAVTEGEPRILTLSHRVGGTSPTYAVGQG